MLLPKIWIICRVCLKQEQELFNIFDDIFNKSIWALLRDCGGVPVRKSDDLPDKICKGCLRKLWKAQNFRIDCQRGHRQLVQMLEERSAFMYKIDLEEENKCSEFATISNSSNDCRPLDSLGEIKESFFNNTEEAHENIPTNPNSNVNSRVDQDDSGHDINEYFVVTKTGKIKDQEEINKLVEKEPIVLLLKKKNMPHAKGHSESNRMEAPTQTGPKFEIDKQPVTKGLYLKSKIPETSTSKSKLNRTEIKFTCKVCRKTYKSYEDLHQHLYIHKRTQERKNLYKKIKFKCEKCHKDFRLKHLLGRHAENHRAKECFICNKNFSSAHMVRIHHQREHLKVNT